MSHNMLLQYMTEGQSLSIDFKLGIYLISLSKKQKKKKEIRAVTGLIRLIVTAPSPSSEDVRNNKVPAEKEDSMFPNSSIHKAAPEPT